MTPQAEETLCIGVEHPVPVFPMYDMRTAAELIPCSYDALKQHVYKLKAKYPARYRRYKDDHNRMRRVRVLSSREILAIRSHKLCGPGKDTQ